jgi:hypothetical protein
MIHEFRGRAAVASSFAVARSRTTIRPILDLLSQGFRLAARRAHPLAI